MEDLGDPRWIVQIGVAPVRIDLHAGLEGSPNFDALWDRRADARFGSVDAHYLGLDDLVNAKEAAGREQDRAAGHRAGALIGSPRRTGAA